MQSDLRPPLVPPFTSPDGLAGIGRQAFRCSLSQHERLLSIDTSLEPGALIVTHFTGQEMMSALFRFHIDCIATSTEYELKALIGEEASLRLRLADGATRVFHGMVASCHMLGSDGALAYYRLTLVPWLHELNLRGDSYVFQDKSVPEIVEDILRDYPRANWRFDLRTALPRRSLTLQYRESDYAFMRRLLAEEGLSFFFEHGDAATSSGAAPIAESDGLRAHHRLVIFDDNAALAPCPQSTIRFQRAAATESADSVTMLTRRRQVHTNAVTLSSWDYKTLTATAAEAAVAGAPTNAPVLEHHEGADAYRYTDTTESTRIARARSQSLALAHESTWGESSVRQLAAGTWFTLTDHVDADGAYAVLAVDHQAANNLDAALAPLAPTNVERGTYRNQFLCTPYAMPVRPDYRVPDVLAPGMQVALVTGVDGEEITTERDHRVKIQFPWQRGDRAAPGQLPHPSTSNAPGNETAGTWVRVTEPAAGANWGAAFVPRIDREICIGFVAGDADRPVLTGQLYNDVDLPPFHGADNHSGALAGIRSKEYAADGFNQWVIDDTPTQLRHTVTSSHAASQVNLGYLIRQDGNTRGVYRGLGFELASDAWSTLRAARGLFVSTAQRGEASSTQLDTQEAQGRLTSAGQLARTLSDAATLHDAQALSTPQGVTALLNKVDGKDRADGQPAATFTQPVTLFDSAAGVGMTTPASSVLFAGQDMTLTAASALRMTTGQAVTMVSAKSTSLFTHAGGAKLVAAKEPVSIRAHTGPMDLIADKAMMPTSSNAGIRIQAKQEVLFASGGGYIRLVGSNVDIHCPASVSIKGSSHDFLGPGRVTVAMTVLPNGMESTAAISSVVKATPSLGTNLVNDFKAWRAGSVSAGTVAHMASMQITDAMLPHRAAASHYGATTPTDDIAGMGKEAWNTAVHMAQAVIHANPLLRVASALNGTSDALKSAEIAIPASQAYGANSFDKANLFVAVETGGAGAVEIAESRAAAIAGANSAEVASQFVTTPTRATVRELRDFGLDSAQRRAFFEGKQVLFEDPSTAFETATIFKLSPDTLHAGVYDMISDGSGAVLSFANRSRSLANSLGVNNLELFGADIQNGQLRSLLARRGFEPGAPVKIDGFGFNKYVETLRKTEALQK